MWLLCLEKAGKIFLQYSFGKLKTGTYVPEKMESGYFTLIFIFLFPLTMNMIKE